MLSSDSSSQSPFSKSSRQISSHLALHCLSVQATMSFLSSQQSTSNTQGDLSKDIALTSPPEDSVAGLSFSPTADFLAVASWDKKVRIYQVTEQGHSEGKAVMDFDAPVLGCAWSAVSPETNLAIQTANMRHIGREQSCRSWSRQNRPHVRCRHRDHQHRKPTRAAD